MKHPSCFRSIEGHFEKDVQTPRGIKLWRFSARLSYLANATVNPDNAGFCTPKDNCLDSGVFNVTACQSGKSNASNIINIIYFGFNLNILVSGTKHWS